MAGATLRRVESIPVMYVRSFPAHLAGTLCTVRYGFTYTRVGVQKIKRVRGPLAAPERKIEARVGSYYLVRTDSNGLMDVTQLDRIERVIGNISESDRCREAVHDALLDSAEYYDDDKEYDLAIFFGEFVPVKRNTGIDEAELRQRALAAFGK